MPTWRTLTGLPPTLPRLLLKSSISSQGYTIHLTDLSRIWHQELTAQEITAAARKQKCSIDPGEDAEQYHILQTKFQSALDQEPGTSLTTSVADDSTITLTLSAPLPAPLPALKWAATLSRSPDEAVATHLINPLIHRSALLNSQLASLITELCAKDKIISRLADRLQVSGQDLTVVFPGTAGVRLKAKKSQVEQLAGHIKGLGPFDEESWRAREVDGREGLDGVLGELWDGDEVQEGTGKWWRELRAEGVKLGDRVDGSLSNGSMKSGLRTSESRDAMDVDEDGEDGFQTQDTPPHLRRRTSPPPAASKKNGQDATEMELDGTSEDDEDDLDAPSQRTQPSQRARASQPSQPSQPAVSSQITARSSHTQPSQPEPAPIEPDEDATDPDTDVEAPAHPNPKQPSPTPPPSAEPPAPSKKKLGTIGGKRKILPPPSAKPEPEPEREEKTASRSPPPASIPQPESPAKPKRRLGVMGGKRAATKPAAETPPPETPGSIPVALKKSPKSKLGAFGGRKTGSRAEPRETRASGPRMEEQADEQPTTKAGADAEGGRASRQVEMAEESSTVRETSQERADKKREALKRELDAKSKAPAKKKRKF